MTNEIATYILSIETDAGTYQHGEHLGTEPTTARQIAEEIYRYRLPRMGNRIVTVGLLLNGELVATFDGEFWSDEDRDARILMAITGTRSNGCYFVHFCHVDVRGRTDHAYPIIELPARSYDHAKAIANAYNHGA